LASWLGVARLPIIFAEERFTGSNYFQYGFYNNRVGIAPYANKTIVEVLRSETCIMISVSSLAT